MKRTYPYIALAALALGFTACTQDEDFAPQQSDIVQIASATIATEVQTRVNTLGDGTTFEADNKIRLVNETRKDSKNEGTYTYDGSAWNLTSGMVLYHSTEDNDFTAYYPDDYDGIPDDQSTEAGIKSADYMIATATGVKKGAAVTLNFEHQNAKVTITPTLNVQYKDSYKLSDISDFKINDIPSYKNGDSYVTILEPTTGFTVTLTIGGNTLTATSTQTLEKGKHYTFSLTVGKAVATFGEVKVQEWGGDTNIGEKVEPTGYVTYTLGTDGTAVFNVPEDATADELKEAVTKALTEESPTMLYIPGSFTDSDKLTALKEALGTTTSSITLMLDEAIDVSDLTNVTLNTDGYILNEGTYEVYNATGLNVWGEQARTDLSSNLTLKADIKLSTENITVGDDGIPSGSNWTRVGTGSSSAYTGTIDGGGHKVYNLRIANSEPCTGFVGYLSDGTIKNLTLVNAVVGSSDDYVGAIAGYVKGGTIENCHVTGQSSVTTTRLQSSSGIGGIAGYISATISDCSNSADVSAVKITDSSNYAYIGGIAGSVSVSGTYTIIIRCHNTGNIRTSGCFAGGIAGKIGNSTTIVAACYNTGKIEARNLVGGIVAQAYGTITDCYNKGTVVAEQKGSAGGIAGRGGYSNFELTISNCYNIGTVTASYCCGGIFSGHEASSYAHLTTLTNNYYLTGCATDGNGVVQFGVGNETAGSTTADTSGRTTGMSATEMTNGTLLTALKEGITSDATYQWVAGGDGYPTLQKITTAE